MEYFVMNKITQKEISTTLTAATARVLDAHSSYKPYQPKLEHAEALQKIEEAKKFLDTAAEMIKKYVK